MDNLDNNKILALQNGHQNLGAQYFENAMAQKKLRSKNIWVKKLPLKTNFGLKSSLFNVPRIFCLNNFSVLKNLGPKLSFRHFLLNKTQNPKNAKIVRPTFHVLIFLQVKKNNNF